MSDEVLSAERIAYQATTHECGWAEHHINALVESKVAEALTQAQESLAAARAEALRIGDELNQCLQIIVTNADNFPAGERMFPNEVKEAYECQRNIENAVKRAATAVRSLADTPSDSTALAKLLAEERLDEARWWRAGALATERVKNLESVAARVAELKGEQK